MLQFVFWDVQHGSASHIKTPNDRHLVIDLGTGSYSENKEFSPLMHLKKKYGVGQLDYVVITHPHRDHIDDIFRPAQTRPIGSSQTSTHRCRNHCREIREKTI